MHWVWEANGSAWSLGVSMCRFVSWHLQSLKDPSPWAVAGLGCWPRQARSLLQRAVCRGLLCWGQRMKAMQTQRDWKGCPLFLLLAPWPCPLCPTDSLSICTPSNLHGQWPRLMLEEQSPHAYETRTLTKSTLGLLCRCLLAKQPKCDFCVSARGMRVSTHNVYEGSKRVSGSVSTFSFFILESQNN